MGSRGRAGPEPAASDPPVADPPGAGPAGADPRVADLRVADLRAPLLASSAWLATLVVLLGPRGLQLALAVLLGLAVLGVLAAGTGVTARTPRHSGSPAHGAVRARVRVRGHAPAITPVLAVVAATAGAAAVAGLHARAVSSGPVAGLAEDRASVSVLLQVRSDPRRVEGRYGDRVLVRGTLTEVHGRGRTWRLRSPVVVLADPDWARVDLGGTVRASGRLAPADGDAAALLLARGPAGPVSGPDWWWRGADGVRTSLRGSVAHRPPDQRALVPALVVGDDSRLDPELAEDFRATGLTHLLAVSGTNLTLLVGFLLVLARGLGVRGRGLHLVGALGIVGFVLLARTEPSVVRAAAMGTVALVGLGRNGLQRGTRGLGVAVLVLLLVDPWLAVSAGFALSVLATGGILLLAPAWRDALARWLPRWVAEAVAVPAAAQLACTPVVAAISGQVSLVAVAANLLAAPAVGPATVLGLTGGLLGLVWAPLGRLAGTGAGWCVGWIVVVARHGAGLPTAAVDWAAAPVPIALLTALCLLLAVLAPRLLRRPATGLACAGMAVAAVLLRPPTPGWPPPGWVLTACDVGQGDALVLNAGRGSGVVVDAGPDPEAIDRCLRRLDVDRVPVLVLTHYHADHVDGTPGVLRDREVGQVLVSPLPEPDDGAATTARVLARAGLRPQVVAPGAEARVGRLRLRVLGPLTGPGGVVPGGSSAGTEGDAANDASVVLLAEVGGTRILLTGDVEPPGQAALAPALTGLDVDVLKVPHHGSRYQDLEVLMGLDPEVAVISVGADNEYGHPAPETLVPLERAGVRVLRTDTEGDVVVVSGEDGLAVRGRHR